MGLAVTLDGLAEAGKPQPMPPGAEEPPEPPPGLGDYDATDRAQLLGEYQERLAACETLKDIAELRQHAKTNKGLDADGLGEIMRCCDQQEEAIRNSNQ